ncbi:hypothetical protein KIH39_04445 [Telmatocola sphagniphila]|uniref:Uncharacterized protein n=1 Tax=Telmatocola sphagniphila TaxID=1123043 RepID=A0A8E6EYY5_9BACT|nr:hypothetical protein [Telmatocola sphagniphila]QVL33173.1 hypothetical protein KIH39_04445 [Telmatocola sphagniphila]
MSISAVRFASLVSLVLLLLFSSNYLTAQTDEKKTSSKTPEKFDDALPKQTLKKFSISGKAAPTPRLKYQLQAAVSQRVPGNAALSYYRSILLLNEFNQHLQSKLTTAEEKRKFYTTDEEFYYENLQKPRKEIPIEQFRKFVEDRLSILALKELRSATLCTGCDWDTHRRIDQENVSLLLPELNSIRGLARQINYSTRLDVLDGKFDAAILHLRDGVTLAKRTGEGNTLISMLVGIAVMSQQLGEIEFLIQQQEAPNLFWALTDLPTPFLNKQGVIEGELRGMASLLASFKAADQGPITESKAQDLFLKMTELLRKIAGGDSKISVLEEFGMRAALHIMIDAQQAQAKKTLKEAGKSDKEIESMSPTQRYMVAEWIVCQDVHDTLFTTFNMPLLQASKEFDKQEKKLKELVSDSRAKNPLRNLLMLQIPAIVKVHQANVRLERQLVALRHIEAIRLYVARIGKLPEKLEDITEVTLPNDPLFEKPIEYRLEAGKGILLLPNRPEETATPNNNFRYEISLN